MGAEVGASRHVTFTLSARTCGNRLFGCCLSCSRKRIEELICPYAAKGESIEFLPWSFEFLEKAPLFGSGQPLNILRQALEILF